VLTVSSCLGNDPSGSHGGAGLAPAAGLIRSLSAVVGVTHHSLAAAVSMPPGRHHLTLR
jgi:hypothetical protein